MTTILLAIAIFLALLAAMMKFGNPNNDIQRRHNKNFTDDVVYELEKLKENRKENN